MDIKKLLAYGGAVTFMIGFWPTIVGFVVGFDTLINIIEVASEKDKYGLTGMEWFALLKDAYIATHGEP